MTKKVPQSPSRIKRNKLATQPPRQHFLKPGVLTITIEELAPLIGKSVSSIRSDMARNPERLPKWFKCPGGAKRPLWLVRTVELFIEKQAARCGVEIERGES